MACVVVRADASPEIGTGHVMRCLAVAEALQEQGQRVLFALAETTPAIDARLAAAGFSQVTIPVPAGGEADLSATVALLRQEAAVATMLDGYRFGAPYRAGLKAAGVPVLAWDDLADGTPLHADFVVNAAPQAVRLPYGRLAPGARLLLGPGYAPFRREIREATLAPRLPLDGRRTLILTFGGSDPLGLTAPVLDGLAAVELPDCRLVAVVGGSNPRVAEVLATAAKIGPRAVAVVDTPRMGALMVEAGLAVSAGGGTQGELAALAVPTLLVVSADNQAPASAESAALGWCETVDGRGPDSIARIVAAAVRLWRDPDRRQDMARRAAALPLDGQGAARIAAALTGVTREAG